MVVQEQPVLLLVSLRQYAAMLPELSLAVRAEMLTISEVADAGSVKAVIDGAAISLKVAVIV